MTHPNANSANTVSKSSISSEERKVPTLSLMSYVEGSKTDQIKFIEQLYKGIKDYGFIILKDHNVSEELLHKAYEVQEKFFRLPTESKLKYSGIAGGQRGYTPFGKEHAKDAKVMDLKEFWHVGRQVTANHPYKKYYPDNIWPDQEVPGFREVFSEIYSSLEVSGKAMLQALTFPLEVDIEYFDRMVQDGNSILRLLHYPPIPEGVDPRCIRAAPHEDINLITILPAATQSGLQLKDRDGKWLDVVSDWGTLIVDAGDMLARATNDVIPSTTHQVINAANSKNESRFSMPFFMHPNPEAILSCIPSCRGSGAQYPDITAHEFLMQRLREIGLI
jgi:isopenicillin N synthase-like dioxygenase